MPPIAPRSSRDVPVTLIGHPFATTDKGEEMRAGLRAFARVGLAPEVIDIFRFLPRTDPAHLALVKDREANTVPPDGVRVFHINADEVEPVLRAMAARDLPFDSGYNVVVPAWELPRFPAAWSAILERFDEIWAISDFVAQGLAAAGLPSHTVGQSVEIEPAPFLPRRHFGIREAAFVLLSFFDTTSYVDPKNPYASIDLFKRLRRRRPFADIQLVLKAKSGHEPAAEWQCPETEGQAGILFLSDKLSAHATRSLIAAADCLVSLHRSEGFGRGIGEAMWLRRLAMATGWSGNMDFTTTENSLLVHHTLVPVGESQYPYWQGQEWAEPDIDHALWLAEKAIDDPSRVRALTRIAHLDAQRLAGHRAVGLRMLSRIEAICAAAVEAERPASDEMADPRDPGAAELVLAQ